MPGQKWAPGKKPKYRVSATTPSVALSGTSNAGWEKVTAKDASDMNVRRRIVLMLCLLKTGITGKNFT
jgi:hypothetical protein